MSALKPVTIVGGGLAGLALGIGLRQRKVPVSIWESGRYPRHRVCGEFISGRGQEVLNDLGITHLFQQAGATSAQTAQFHFAAGSTKVRQLTHPALCLSRFTMDQVLAGHFLSLGGDLRQEMRWPGSCNTEGIVLAHGRRVQPVEGGWRWFGLKVHAQNVQLEADLEMHASRDGYVGICRLPEGEVNVCGLFRSRPGNPPQAPKELLRGTPGSSLNARLSKADFDESSFCSVAGLPLLPQRALSQPECRVGDALTMIPPVTGNGMSMAFESAAIALDPIAAYAGSEMTWEETRKSVARSCDAEFRARLFWARWLQSFMFGPVFHSRLGMLLLRCDLLWNQLFVRTR